MKNIKFKNLAYGFVMLLVLSSCIDEPSDLDQLNPYSEVGSSAELSIPTGSDLWIDPTTSSTTFTVNSNEYLSDISALVMSVLVVKADGDVSSASKIQDVTVSDLADGETYVITGTQLLDATGLSASDLTPGDRFQIIFEKTINGKVYKDRASHSVLISCPSAIPVGAYQVAGGSDQIMISYDGAGTYNMSNLNFNYYSPSYGDIPAKFLDVCNDLTLLGFNEGTAYGIAWIGSGTYVEGDKAQLSFTYSDQTYNATYEVSITFVQL